MVQYVDLRALALLHGPQDPRIGLARLTEAVLSRKLDKSQQMSSWGRRPLTNAQVAYAGADAHVLTALLDKLLEGSGLEVDGRTFPAELAEELDVATAAKMARLWHRTKAPPPRQLQDEWSWSPHEAALPEGQSDPEIPEPLPTRRNWQKTPRLDSQAKEHSVNLESLQEFLGQHFPETGRSIIMRVASADDRGLIPSAVPKYSRGGGVVCWKDSFMLFVNVDDQGTSSYPNSFPEDGRKLVWFPGRGHTERHPMIRQMLGLPPLRPSQTQGAGTSVLLFARLRAGYRWRPFMYLGRLHNPQVDWRAGSNGVFEWELQDYAELRGSKSFQGLVQTANSRRSDGNVAV